MEKQSPLATHFSDTDWVANLAYSCDILNLLSELNLSLQERKKTVQVSRKNGCVQSQTGIMGEMSVHWDFFDVFQTLAEILKET